MPLLLGCFAWAGQCGVLFFQARRIARTEATERVHFPIILRALPRERSFG
jgi:hypothetical protein